MSGESRGLVVPKELTYNNLVSLVCSVANIDINSCKIIIHGMGYRHLGQLKMIIIANVDVSFALMEDRCTPVIYVTSGVEHNMHGQVDGMQHKFSPKLPTHTVASCSNQVCGSVPIIQQPRN